jgi:hypothetical protein
MGQAGVWEHDNSLCKPDPIRFADQAGRYHPGKLLPPITEVQMLHPVSGFQVHHMGSWRRP